MESFSVPKSLAPRMTRSSPVAYMSANCGMIWFREIVGLISFLFLSALRADENDSGCPESWVLRNETSECYFIGIYGQELDFNGSEVACEKMSATMVIIGDAATSDFLNSVLWQFLSNEIGQESSDVFFWIGLYLSSEISSNDSVVLRRMGWTWLDGSGYSAWNDWSADYPTGDNRCAGIRTFSNSSSFSSYWKDVDCSTRLPYICQKNVSKMSFLADISSDTPPQTTSYLRIPQTSSQGSSSSNFSGGSDVDATKTAFPVFTDADDRMTDWSTSNVSLPENGTGIENGNDANRSRTSLGIYIGVPFAVVIGVVVTIVLSCLLCEKQRRAKNESSRCISVTLDSLEQSESCYDNIETVMNQLESLEDRTTRRGTIYVRGYTPPSSPVSTTRSTTNPNRSRFHRIPTPLPPLSLHQSLLVPFEECSQLSDRLLTLKRSLENYVVNGNYMEEGLAENKSTVNAELVCLFDGASSAIADVLWLTYEEAHDPYSVRPRLAKPVRVPYGLMFDCRSCQLYILETMTSFQVKIEQLLEIFPVDGLTSTLDRCRRTAESISALLKMGAENLAGIMPSATERYETTPPDDDDERNPLVRELCDRLPIVCVRLETFVEVGFCITFDDAWQTLLLDSIHRTESVFRELFSDSTENRDSESAVAADEDASFRDKLSTRLRSFHRATEPVLSSVEHFFIVVDSPSADYMRAALESAIALAVNILQNGTSVAADVLEDRDAVYEWVLEETGDGNAVYQNLPGAAMRDRMDDVLNLVPPLPLPLSDVQLHPLFDRDDVYSVDSYGFDGFDVHVDRTSPSWLEDTFRRYRNVPLEQLRQSVKVTFVGESGVDGGALSREFFFMAFNELIGQSFLSHDLFEGGRGNLLPAIDHVLTESRAFWFVGVMTAQAVNRGCKGLPGLCNALRRFLFLDTKISNITKHVAEVSPDDISNLDLREVVRKIQNKEELNADENSIFESWATDSNFSKVLNSATESEAVQRILCYYVFDSRMTQIQAIAEGINDIGIRNKPSIGIEQMFPVDEKLTLDDVLSGITMEPTTRAQRKSRKYFQIFCRELHYGKVNGLTLEDLLHFFTGAPYFVSMAAAEVRFADPTEKNSLPMAHACASMLVLPTVHKTYPDFRKAMVMALELCPAGFGLV